MVSTWSSPNPVLYGSGSSETTGSHLKRLGCTKVMVVHDPGIKPAAEKIIQCIREEGIECIIYDNVLPNAPDVTVNEAAEIARAAEVDGVVAIGGGSAVDTGKGVCVLLSNEPPISRYYIRPGLPAVADVEHLKPLIVIPTTAGTGTEVTPGGCIYDSEHDTKENTVCPTSLGIVDPMLTLGLSKMGTVATGLDAMCHAIEAYLSNEPNPFSDIFAENAIRLVAQYLPRAAADGSDIEARENMHLAATIGAMSILGPFCNVGHDIGAVIGVDFHVTHGLAVSFCLPEIMRFLAPARIEKVANIVRALGVEVADDISGEELAGKAYDAFKGFLERVDYPPLNSFVPSKEQLLASVDKIMETQIFHFSPKPVTREDIVSILSGAWERNSGA